MVKGRHRAIGRGLYFPGQVFLYGKRVLVRVETAGVLTPVK